MNSNDTAKITPGAPANNRAGSELRLPTRAELSRARLLKQGRRGKADLWTLDIGAGPMVIKDFKGRNPWFRMLGRLQVSREVRAYRKLGALPGVPKLIGRIDAFALAVEHIDGLPLSRAADRPEDAASKLVKLREILDRMHATGVVHWDLRARKNVLLTPEGQIYVLDFASAMWLPPGSLAYKLLFPWFREIDESAFLKWKQILGVGPLSERETSLVRRHKILRSLWVFNSRNRKGNGSDGQGPSADRSGGEAK